MVVTTNIIVSLDVISCRKIISNVQEEPGATIIRVEDPSTLKRGSSFRQNVAKYLHDCTASDPRRQSSLFFSYCLSFKVPW
jgi:hypothetical protein